MPKDIKKSFDTKARNAIMKYMQQWQTNPERITYVRDHHENPVSSPMTIEDWFNRAVDPKDDTYLPYTSLRNIHNLLVKCVRIGEDMSDSIQRLRDELAVARVMMS
jgi:hypothetical protein